MSEQQPEPEAIELAPSGDGAFAALMDTLVGDAAAAEVGEKAAPSDAPGGGGDAPAGVPTAGDQGVSGTAGPGTTPGAGQPGATGAAAPGTEKPAAGTAAGDAAGSPVGDRPTEWIADAADFIPKLGELSTKLEENTQNAYRAEALKDVQTDHEKYFDALKQHPRLLVGQSVPRIGGEGNETLKDTADAREWQEAVKQILVEEVEARASVKLDENKDFLQTVHQSIDLFKNNVDLIPTTKTFDTELANRFATFAKPYELRVDGKLQGYSIQVQPIIDQLREQLVKDRAAGAVGAPAAAADAGGASTPPPADPPQAGVQSKAGNGDQKEDFSTLWGTIGLPNMTL